MEFAFEMIQVSFLLLMPIIAESFFLPSPLDEKLGLKKRIWYQHLNPFLSLD